MSNSLLYWYDADVKSITDGDTIRVLMRWGCGEYTDKEIRFARIDAWEKTGAEKAKGIPARDWLVDQITQAGNRVVIKTYKDKTGKYGRLLADVYIGDLCLNDELVRLGHAEYREY